MRAPLSRFLILLAYLFILTLASFAQFSQRGSISGVVTEASGAVVPKASVMLLDLGRNQKSSVDYRCDRELRVFPTPTGQLSGLCRARGIQEVSLGPSAGGSSIGCPIRYPAPIGLGLGKGNGDWLLGAAARN